jgi:hypothetical protein
LQILCSKLGSGTILSVFPKQNAFPLPCSVRTTVFRAFFRFLFPKF